MVLCFQHSQTCPLRWDANVRANASTRTSDRGGRLPLRIRSKTLSEQGQRHPFRFNRNEMDSAPRMYFLRLLGTSSGLLCDHLTACVPFQTFLLTSWNGLRRDLASFLRDVMADLRTPVAAALISASVVASVAHELHRSPARSSGLSSSIATASRRPSDFYSADGIGWIARGGSKRRMWDSGRYSRRVF